MRTGTDMARFDWLLFTLFESVIRLVPAKLWNFLGARMLYDKCIEN